MKFFSKKALIFGMTLIITLLFAINTVSANVNAEKHAPIFYFEAEEKCFPVSVEYFLANSDLSEIITEGESIQFYNANDDILSDYQSKFKNNDPLVYPTVYYIITEDSGNQVIQYWMFYAYNEGELNHHEGDWEMVQVVIPSTGSKWVGYSQHHSGQRAPWNLVEKNGDNIKVYVARGSHSNYLRPYSGKVGISADIVGDNGKILKPTDYELKNLDDQDWLDFEGRWGDVGENIDEKISGMLLGTIGPHGPKYRENGNMWDNPVSWGENLPEASSLFFMLEWFVYNAVTLFLLITILVLLLTIFFIYRRHKKYGLGPRICSIFYIDGLNLKSIGNILCFVAVIIAVIGLFSQWYGVSYEIISDNTNGIGVLETEGVQDMFIVDGIKGLQVVIPGENGPTPMMSLLLPFSLFIGIGLAFLFIKAIGINQSRKLGGKYLFKGIRIMIPVFIIFIGIISLGMLIPANLVGEENVDNYGAEIVSSISSKPFGGSKEIVISEDNFTGYFSLDWGLKTGGQMLIFSGIIFIAAGVFLFASNSVFFEPRNPYEQKRKKDKKTPPPPQNQVNQTPPPPPPIDSNTSQLDQTQDPSEYLPPPPPPPPPENQMQQMPPPPPQPVQKETDAPPSPPPPVEQKTKKEKATKIDKPVFCTNCGSKLEEGADFCSECGTKIDTNSKN